MFFKRTGEPSGKVFFLRWDNNTVSSIRGGGGSISVVANARGLTSASAIIIYGTHVYWADANCIHRTGTGRGRTKTIVPGARALEEKRGYKRKGYFDEVPENLTRYFERFERLQKILA